MNYLRAYTPRVRPLNYDSLRSEIGCLPISGSKVNELLPFSEECVTTIQPDATFDRSDLVSTFLGPDDHLAPEEPYATSWSVWQATTTIRVGQFSTITLPSNSLGEESRLFAGTVTTKLSGAFNRQGRLVIAIQKSTGIIQIRRYTDELGAVATIEFAGTSPALIYLGLVFVSELPEQSEVVCYYLRSEKPGMIFVRLESDDFAIEHPVNNQIRATPNRLLYAKVADRRVILRARDELDRYLTYESDPYELTSTDTIDLGATISGGEYFNTGVNADADEEEISLGATITDGLYFLAIVEPVGEVPDAANFYTQSGFNLERDAGTRVFSHLDVGKRYTSTANPLRTGIIIAIVDNDNATVDSDLEWVHDNITFSALSSQRITLNVSITSGEYVSAEI